MRKREAVGHGRILRDICALTNRKWLNYYEIVSANAGETARERRIRNKLSILEKSILSIVKP